MPSKTPESLRKMYVPLEFRTFYLKYKDTYLHELWKLLKLLEDLLQDKFEFILMLLKANKIDQAKRALKEALCQCADATTTANTNATVQTQAQLPDTNVEMPDYLKDNPWVSIIASRHK